MQIQVEMHQLLICLIEMKLKNEHIIVRAVTYVLFRCLFPSLQIHYIRKDSLQKGTCSEMKVHNLIFQVFCFQLLKL